MTDSPGSSQTGASVTYMAQRISPSGLAGAPARGLRPPKRTGRRKPGPPPAEVGVFFLSAPLRRSGAGTVPANGPGATAIVMVAPPAPRRKLRSRHPPQQEV